MSDAKRIAENLNRIAAALAYLEARRISRARALELLDKAKADGDRDITTDEAQAELDALQAGLDDTQDLIDGEENAT